MVSWRKGCGLQADDGMAFGITAIIRREEKEVGLCRGITIPASVGRWRFVATLKINDPV